MYMYICIYVYGDRERGTGSGRKGERGRRKREWNMGLIWGRQTEVYSVQSAVQGKAGGIVTRDTAQNSATHCDTLQRTAMHHATLQHSSPHGNTLYHTAMDTLGGRTRELLKRDSQTFEARFEHFCGRLDRRYGSEC